MWYRSALAAIAACSALVQFNACAGSAPTRAVSPTRLDARLPTPGFCRILAEDPERFAPQQSCDDIEFQAPPGSTILFRPAGGARVAIMCYMSPALRSTIYSIDLFDVDTGEHIEVLMPVGGRPPTGGCKSALELRAR